MIGWERRAQIESVFEAALDQPPDARLHWLEAFCGDDVELRAEVVRLLNAHERASGILERSAAHLAATLTAHEGSIPGERLGPYRLIREIGRGGMGRVYLAARDDAQYEQRVAVKILDRGYSSDLIARFLTERQILASLAHPNIARLLDGGMTRDGRPYYVMEYVDGEHLDVYCNRRSLSIEERLRLFRDIALTVHHAHRNLIVHRDLKPSNILVTPDGTIKLLDFGIAKLLDPDTSHPVPLTETGDRLMTPEYASPEQVAGRPITTAVDVYALGLVLYELLTGHRPQRRDAPSLADVERRILTEDPVPPSVAVMMPVTDTAGRPGRRVSAGVARPNRQLSALQLHRKLRGDLDRIVLMAIRKEPERRYGSAEQLAADIERYLAGSPVIARGDSTPYRLRKFIVRHRLGVGAAAAFVMLLAGYAATVTVQSRRVQSALVQARLEAEKAEQVTAFTLGLFETRDLTQVRHESLTVRDLLRRGAERAERLDRQPAAQAEMFDVLGRIHQRLGEYAAAQPFLERALTVRRLHFGERHVATAESMTHLASLLFARGQYTVAESLYRAALTLQRELVGEQHPRVARTLDGLGVLLQNRGDYRGAEELTREALAMRRRLLGDEHPEVAQSLSNLALQLQLQGRFADAEPLYHEVIAMRRRLFGDEHPEVASAMSNLGLLLVQKGESERAESLYHGALAMRRRFFGDDHPDVALSQALLGALLRRKGDLAAAESLYREAIARAGRSLGEEHPDLAHHLNGLALVLRDKGDYAAAESLYRHVLTVRQRMLGEKHPAIAMSLTQLGALLQERGDLAAAEPFLLRALQMRRDLLGDGHPHTQESARQLATLYEAWGRPERAREYRPLLEPPQVRN